MTFDDSGGGGGHDDEIGVDGGIRPGILAGYGRLEPGGCG